MVAKLVKNLPAMRETHVGSLDWEDSTGEGNGNPLQYSCLENSSDRWAWWAPVPGVAKSQTQLSNTFHFHLVNRGCRTKYHGDTSCHKHRKWISRGSGFRETIIWSSRQCIWLWSRDTSLGFSWVCIRHSSRAIITVVVSRSVVSDSLWPHGL